VRIEERVAGEDDPQDENHGHKHPNPGQAVINTFAIAQWPAVIGVALFGHWFAPIISVRW